jgi:hypothetical protein
MSWYIADHPGIEMQHQSVVITCFIRTSRGGQWAALSLTAFQGGLDASVYLDLGVVIILKPCVVILGQCKTYLNVHPNHLWKKIVHRMETCARKQGILPCVQRNDVCTEVNMTHFLSSESNPQATIICICMVITARAHLYTL